MTTELEIEGDARLLWAAAHGASDETTRYYLNGVYAAPAGGGAGGAVFVATDGHCLVAAHDAAATVSRPAIIGLTKRRKGGGLQLPFSDTEIWKRPTRFRFDGRRLSLHVAAVAHGAAAAAAREPFAEARAQEVDGTFPDARRVFPQEHPPEGSRFAFAPHLIGRFEALRARFDRDHTGPSDAAVGPFVPGSQGDGAPGAFRLSPCGRVMGLVMPTWRTTPRADLSHWRHLLSAPADADAACA